MRCSEVLELGVDFVIFSRFDDNSTPEFSLNCALLILKFLESLLEYVQLLLLVLCDLSLIRVLNLK